MPAPSRTITVGAPIRIGLSAALTVALASLAVRPWLPRPAIPPAPVAARRTPPPAPPPLREPEPLPAPPVPDEPVVAEPIAGDPEPTVPLPPSDDYDIRCAYNAHATRGTVEHLRRAVARVREVYPGQLVIGDISRRYGGSFGTHASHRSGRDVDIWLPIVGGLYRTAPECSNCGNSWCRAAPDEVDWRTTWTLIRILLDTGAVERIFLDRSLHPRLAAAALATGARVHEVARTIQRRPGAPAPVMHSPGHSRHLHVRFTCDPGDTCDE
jgi:hypothetical protein